MYSLFNTTTMIMVIQKKAPGQAEESTMAITIVMIKIITIATILHTIRVVRSPLEIVLKKIVELVKGFHCNNGIFVKIL